jgi:FkbM family methyltransferase
VEGRLRFDGGTRTLWFRERDIYVIGEILHAGLYRLGSVLPASPLVIDAGANIGIASLWLAAKYPGARLVCFEPERENFALLQRNLTQIAGATCVQAALGAHAGEAVLHVTDNASDHSLTATPGPSRPQRVPCLTLDDYLEGAGIDRVDLLKLDVEGSELDVLEGMRRTAGRVQVIAGECHERLVDAGAFYRELAELGFRVVATQPGRVHEQAHMFEATR